MRRLFFQFVLVVLLPLLQELHFCFLHVVLVPLGVFPQISACGSCASRGLWYHGGWFGCGEDGSWWWIMVGSSRTCRLQCPMGGGSGRVACIQEVGFFFPFIICYTGNQTYTDTLPPRNTPSLKSFTFDNVILLCFCHLCYEHVKKNFSDQWWQACYLFNSSVLRVPLDFFTHFHLVSFCAPDWVTSNDSSQCSLISFFCLTKSYSNSLLISFLKFSNLLYTIIQNFSLILNDWFPFVELLFLFMHDFLLLFSCLCHPVLCWILKSSWDQWDGL